MIKNNWQVSILGGLASAALLLLGLVYPQAFTSLISFCHIPLFMIALAFSHVGAMIGCIAGSILMLISTEYQGVAKGGPLVFMAIIGLPALLLGYFGLLVNVSGKNAKWYPVGMILVWLTAAALALYTSFFIADSGGANSISQYMQDEIVKNLSTMMTMPADQQITEDDLRTMVASILPYMPGMVLGFLLLTTIINAIIAQWLLVAIKKNQRPMPKMAELDLPNWTPILVAGVGLIAAFAPSNMQVWGINVLLILAVPLMMAGLSVIHLLAQNSKSRLWWLGMVYVALMFSPFLGMLPIILLAALGLAEQWLEIKNRQNLKSIN